MVKRVPNFEFVFAKPALTGEVYMINNFDEKFLAKIEAIAHCLGNGWVINQLHKDRYRVHLISKEIRGACMSISGDKSRWKINSYVSIAGSNRVSSLNSITVDHTRSILSLTNDIKRRLLPGVADSVKKAVLEKEAAEQQKQEEQFFIEAIGRLVNLKENQGYARNLLCRFSSDRLQGSICKDFYGRFNLELSDLSEDILFKILSVINEANK